MSSAGDHVDQVTPLFLISLPRSGSTLLQRMLAGHPEVSTSPEPTFLLPLLHIDRCTDVVATFDQRYTAWAVQDFISSLPDGRATYLDAVREFAIRLYSEAAAGTEVTYHLDKTPKYHLVIDEIAEIFPDSPIILLWRNPLAVVSSLTTTWGKGGGRWNVADFRLDLFDGLPKMLEAADRYPEQVIEIRYEDLVADPTASLTTLTKRLGLEFSDTMVEDFADVSLIGRVQDPNVATPGFETVRNDRVDGWTEVLSNPIRRRWCQRYLDWLGDDRLERMGYSRAEIDQDLEATPVTSQLLRHDAIDMPFDLASRLVEARLLRKKLNDWKQGRGLLGHK